MKKNLIVGILVIVVLVAAIVGVIFLKNDKNSDALRFKEEYESLNGAKVQDKEHRTIEIDSDNPFVYSTADEIVEKIENGETFYVYFGSKLCPWCRSVIEKAIEVANRFDVEKIYYVDIWDDDGNEIVRDKYVLEGNDAKLEIKGQDSYYKLLEYFSNLLPDYELVTSDGVTVNVGEKRIYAPTFFYIKKGSLEKMTEGTSELQTNSRETLTEEILKDEDDIFSEFFNN